MHKYYNISHILFIFISMMIIVIFIFFKKNNWEQFEFIYFIFFFDVY